MQKRVMEETDRKQQLFVQFASSDTSGYLYKLVFFRDSSSSLENLGFCQRPLLCFFVIYTLLSSIVYVKTPIPTHIFFPHPTMHIQSILFMHTNIQICLQYLQFTPLYLCSKNSNKKGVANLKYPSQSVAPISMEKHFPTCKKYTHIHSTQTTLLILVVAPAN